MLLIIVLLAILLISGSFGYYGHSAYGAGRPWLGPGVGLGVVLLIVLFLWILTSGTGLLHSPYWR